MTQCYPARINLLGPDTKQENGSLPSRVSGKSVFRAGQVMKWIHPLVLIAFEDMTNCRKVLR